MNRSELWAAIHAERARLTDDLAGLSNEQWATRSLCGDWVVEDVVAHLTAAASVGRLRWITSVLGARFDFELHNQRRLEEQRGATPAETLDRFCGVITNTTAASGHLPAWLGEVVVHGQDIRRPLELTSTPDVAAVTEVARFFVSRDFTVASRSSVKGLHLEATDGPFESGSGPLVRGTTLALTMAMAGREEYCADLSGDGVATLRARISAG